jgi:hypothetical protein
MTSKKRIRLAVWSTVIGMVVALAWYFLLAPLYHIAHGAGLLERHDMRTYSGTNEDNLRALYTAANNYHETEDTYPDSAKWMDQIKNRIRANDMAEQEAEKKFINPLYPARAGLYGYAFNDALSGKYKGDIKDPKTILIYDSKDTRWNAHGKPSDSMQPPGAPGGNEGITVDGSIVQISGVKR